MMKLSEPLIKKLGMPFLPSAMVEMTYKGKDLSVKTDENGNAILLFIGTRQPDGTIRGERYARTLKYDRSGRRIKDHWELKGQAT